MLSQDSFTYWWSGAWKVPGPNNWFDREFPECRSIISESRKTIGAAIIAATARSGPAAKIASGVHSVWFWFAKRLRPLRLAIPVLIKHGLCFTNPFGQPECQR